MKDDQKDFIIEWNKHKTYADIRWSTGRAEVYKHETHIWDPSEKHRPRALRGTIKANDWWNVYFTNNKRLKSFKVKVQNNDFNVAFNKVIDRIIKLKNETKKEIK